MADVSKEHMGPFLAGRVQKSAAIYTDESRVYRGLVRHESVCHGRGDYVRGEGHTSGIESFWALMKHEYLSIYHQWSKKHLHRYVAEFCGRHNSSGMTGLDRMGEGVFNCMRGSRLLYRKLVG